MKALLLKGYNKLVYTDVPDPGPSEKEVLINVKACGICGSDIHGLDGSTGRRIPPLIMGHEASGIIVAKGRAVTSWNEGDRVTFDSTVFPLNDWYTLEGMYNLSDNREVLGVSPEIIKGTVPSLSMLLFRIIYSTGSQIPSRLSRLPWLSLLR